MLEEAMAHRTARASTAGRRATGPATVRTVAKVAGDAEDASRAGAAAKAAGPEVRCLRLALCNDILFFFFFLLSSVQVDEEEVAPPAVRDLSCLLDYLCLILLDIDNAWQHRA
jgi:hypothetical protein